MPTQIEARRLYKAWYQRRIRFEAGLPKMDLGALWKRTTPEDRAEWTCVTDQLEMQMGPNDKHEQFAIKLEEMGWWPNVFNPEVAREMAMARARGA